MQAGQVHHRGPRLVDGAPGELVALHGRREVLEEQGELTGPVPHRDVRTAGHDDSDGRGQVGVEPHLAPVGTGEHLARSRIGRRELGEDCLAARRGHNVTR